MSEDLVAFLRARLDEDERIAKAAIGDHYSVSFGHSDWTVIEHIDRWTSARVLADVQAKRAIIQAWRDACDNPYREMRQAGHAEGLEEAMTLLANTYANHPDFRPEWGTER